MCDLGYIPEHLCQREREPVPQFEIGEKLYFRCKENQLHYPYESLSLATLSHNRNFCDPSTYNSEDVLWNTVVSSSEQKYTNLKIAELEIQSLDEFTFKKKLVSTINPELYLTIVLVHTPLVCMFPHCEFKFHLLEVEVTMLNYNQTLNVKSGPDKKALRELRTDARIELKSMLVTGYINSMI